VPTSTLLSFTLTSDIYPGKTYGFKIRAANIHGWGTFGTVLNIKAAGIPSQMSAPVTSIDATTGHVRIQLTAPHDGSQSISQYIIEIADSTATNWTPDSSNCPGTNPAVLSCLISMNTLTSAPYNYAFD